MEFSFEGKCVLTLDHKNGSETSTHVGTSFNLNVSRNLNRSMYLDKEELPTKEGARILTDVFVQGLVGNIHHSHNQGFRDSAEHLRYIISELEKGFVSVAIVDKGVF